MADTIKQLTERAAERSKPPVHHHRGWGGSAQIGTIYKINVGSDTQRIGNCWAKDRIFVGDYILCVDKSGDCFYDYVLLDVKQYSNREDVSLTAVTSKFGAYQIGQPVAELNDREFAAVQIGMKVSVRI